MEDNCSVSVVLVPNSKPTKLKSEGIAFSHKKKHALEAKKQKQVSDIALISFLEMIHSAII